MKILAVDDKRDILNMLESVFKEQGHDVLKAINGAEALEMVQQTPGLDLVISDHQMPVMTGSELIVQLKKRGFGKIPFILWSGQVHAVSSDAKTLAYRVLSKPHEFSELERSVALLSEYKSNRNCYK